MFLPSAMRIKAIAKLAPTAICCVAAAGCCCPK
jgi:hypothetical protein